MNPDELHMAPTTNPENPINVELLARIGDLIAKRPEHFYMSAYYSENECGTTGCIAGYALALTNYPDVAGLTKKLTLSAAEHNPNDNWQTQQKGARALGLTEKQSDRLFHVGNWPDAFRDRYQEATSENDPRVLAQISVERIAHFVATNGAE